MSEQPYSSKWYFAMGLEPIHIGSGGKELGIVDSTVTRDPNTKIPKIPATSLAGACRSHTAIHYPEKFLRERDDGTFASCAGKTGEEHTDHCGNPDCPVCLTYGFARDEKMGFQALAQFMDAQLLFFPVHSMAGPIWVTSVSNLKNLVANGILKPEHFQVKIDENSNQIQTTVRKDKLNFGWILLEVASNNHPLTQDGKQNLIESGVPNEILKRVALVSDRLFGHIVNNNMEIRTSVSIDPNIGAAKKGALFNYEAIPRTAVFYFEVVYKDPKNFEVGGKRLDYDYQWVQKNVELGMRSIEALGLGGMTSRGMGKLRFLNLDTEK